MQLLQKMEIFMEQHRQEAYELLLELAQIPAPSNHEEKRAEFCRKWLTDQGAEGVYIDDALNVIWPVGCDRYQDLVVFMAHSDVVFPDTEKLQMKVENGRICCPGVGDDTANVVALLMCAKFIAREKILPKACGLLLVVNSGEEGLGNLKGSRKIIADFGNRIREFVTLDGTSDGGVCRAVGSKRYRVEIDTEGGHSYSAFGNRNAIVYLASLIDALYTIKVPENGKTTYNVGTISGGTSVNTIAQHAEMLYEFRSDERESLEIMEQHFMAAIAFYRTKGIEVRVTLVGDRPCAGNVSQEKMEEMMARADVAAMKRYGHGLRFGSGSTDCNIPLAEGIPAICVGCYRGAGAHTRGEYVEIESLLPGLRFAGDLILHHF